MNEFLNHIENVKSMLLLETMKLPEDTTPKLRVYIRLPEINIRGLWIFYLACMSKIIFKVISEITRVIYEKNFIFATKYT